MSTAAQSTGINVTVAKRLIGSQVHFQTKGGDVKGLVSCATSRSLWVIDGEEDVIVLLDSVVDWHVAAQVA